MLTLENVMLSRSVNTSLPIARYQVQPTLQTNGYNKNTIKVDCKCDTVSHLEQNTNSSFYDTTTSSEILREASVVEYSTSINPEKSNLDDTKEALLPYPNDSDKITSPETLNHHTINTTQLTTNSKGYKHYYVYNEECAICIEPFQDGSEVKVQPCQHGFHPECVDPWQIVTSSQCPICKRSITEGYMPARLSKLRIFFQVQRSQFCPCQCKVPGITNVDTTNLNYAPSGQYTQQTNMYQFNPISSSGDTRSAYSRSEVYSTDIEVSRPSSYAVGA